jgi:hypothetical protein
MLHKPNLIQKLQTSLKLHEFYLTVTHNPVLIVIDIQKGFMDQKWGNSNNPGCEDNIK